jgi:hypothetical protein
MGSARHSTKEGIHPVGFIFISTKRSTRRNAKMQTYLWLIGQFHGPFGRSWRKRRRR